jgi:hypothetical protein
MRGWKQLQLRPQHRQLYLRLLHPRLQRKLRYQLQRVHSMARLLRLHIRVPLHRGLSLLVLRLVRSPPKAPRMTQKTPLT